MNFLAQAKRERNSGLKFFFSFSAYLIPFWLKIMPEIGFLIFWKFLLFFSEFSCLGCVWKEWGTKFFFFFGLSHSVLAKNNAGKRIFNFLNFFCYFFRNFLPRAEHERNSGLKDFSRFLGLSHPVLAKINAGKRFVSFLNFFAIFFGIFLLWSCMNGIRD